MAQAVELRWISRRFTEPYLVLKDAEWLDHRLDGLAGSGGSSPYHVKLSENQGDRTRDFQ